MLRWASSEFMRKGCSANRGRRSLQTGTWAQGGGVRNVRSWIVDWHLGEVKDDGKRGGRGGAAVLSTQTAFFGHDAGHKQISASAKMPRPLLKMAQPVVRQYCHEVNIPYREPGFIESMREIYAYCGRWAPDAQQQSETVVEENGRELT